MDAVANPPEERKTSRFIPLTRRAVIAELCNDPAGKSNRADFVSLALRLQAHRGHFYRKLGEEMRSTYLPFSPDRDTVRVLQFSAEEKADLSDRLYALTRNLLDRANYSVLSTEQLNAILNEETPYALRIAVDLAEYDELQLYYRDVYVREYAVRRPETLYLLKAHYRVRTFRRLFVLLKLKSAEAVTAEIAQKRGISQERAARFVRNQRKALPPGISTDHIYVKVFKDMPEHDLQILFPLRTVQFRPFDKIKFFATAGGGTLFGAFTTTGKILAATNPIALLGAFIGFVALLARQISNFFNQRTRYMMELAQKLFFHNLANNRAALTLLLDRAEEEDVKEDLVTIYLHAGETIPHAELPSRKARIDQMLYDRYGLGVDFDLNDAVKRLTKEGVITDNGEALTFATLAEAAEIYAEHLKADYAEDEKHVCDGGPKADVMEA